MKNIALLLPLALVASMATADAPKPADKPAAAPAPAAADKAAEKPVAGKSHDVAAEVVSADVEKKTLTIKGEKDNKTVPVDEKAAASLKDLKAGDKVSLSCWDNEKGEHVKVTAIKKAAK